MKPVASRNRSDCGDTDDASRGRCQFRDNEIYSEGFDTSQLLGDIFEDEQELLKRHSRILGLKVC